MFQTVEDFYILGLWLADGYWRSSSIGLTSEDLRLINRFTKFLSRVAPQCAIKKRIYSVDGIAKRKQNAEQVYVNNRYLTRLFMRLKTEELQVPNDCLLAYLAGRIDGDGHVDSKYRTGIRIAYGNYFDAKRDQELFGETNMSLYQYQAAKTFVLYFRKHFLQENLSKLRQYSLKLAP